MINDKIKQVKKVLPKVVFQFTFKSKLYKINDTFRGTKQEEELLTLKNYIK